MAWGGKERSGRRRNGLAGKGEDMGQKKGHRVNAKHFTGKTKGKKIRRKGPSRKERQRNRRTHVNKYERER